MTLSPDRELVARAARSHNVLTSAELVEAGLDDKAVARRVAAGWPVRVHRGVYRVGALPAPLSEEAAALLACGRRAVLSHGSAAAVRGFGRRPPAGVDVTLAGGQVRSRGGIRVHRTSALAASDVRRRDGLRLTSPARTLLDLAATLPPADLERAIDEARVLRLVTPARLRGRLAGAGRQRGIAALREIVREEPPLIRSEAERRLLALVRRAQLPLPQTNVRLGGHEVDALWRAQRLVVEVDGYAYHSSPAAFARDRCRDADLLALGHRVLRLTYRQLTREPEAVAARLAGLLAVR